MKVIICDDRQQHLETLEALCRRYIAQSEMAMELTCTQSPDEVLANPPDILILDIEMPGMSGIDVKNALDGENTMILFATEYSEYMSEAFGRNVIGFMSKPVRWEQLKKMMDSAVRNCISGKIVVLEDGTSVAMNKLVMLVTDHGYTTAVLDGGACKMNLRKSLTQWEKELAPDGFLRINQSTLVNSRFVQKFEDWYVVLTNGQRIRFSTRNRKKCFQEFLNYQKKMARFV